MQNNFHVERVGSAGDRASGSVGCLSERRSRLLLTLFLPRISSLSSSHIRGQDRAASANDRLTTTEKPGGDGGGRDSSDALGPGHGNTLPHLEQAGVPNIRPATWKLGVYVNRRILMFNGQCLKLKAEDSIEKCHIGKLAVVKG